MNISFQGIKDVKSSFGYIKNPKTQEKNIPAIIEMKLDNEGDNDLEKISKSLPTDVFSKSEIKKFKKDGTLEIFTNGIISSDGESITQVNINGRELYERTTMMKLVDLLDKVENDKYDKTNNAPHEKNKLCATLIKSNLLRQIDNLLTLEKYISDLYLDDED